NGIERVVFLVATFESDVVAPAQPVSDAVARPLSVRVACIADADGVRAVVLVAYPNAHAVALVRALEMKNRNALSCNADFGSHAERIGLCVRSPRPAPYVVTLDAPVAPFDVVVIVEGLAFDQKRTRGAAHRATN